MASQALYLKWRPQTFEEVVGQDHVTKTLRNALERDKIAHAYLFCGPRGTGKTSTARILAKAVNCLSEDEPRPCNHCAICLAINDGTLMDLIEIDAASHTGVDNVREIRDKAGFRPNQARYKVYVIDEVHMLSNAAFNALLKTLEEPPPHVIFVLATTEPHKIPATVISRCQRFDFRFVPTTEIEAHLRRIAEGEGLKIDQEAIDLIAAHAGGAVRDAVTLLDQLTAYGDAGITVEHVQQLLGIGPAEALPDLVDALIRHQVSAGLAVIAQLVDQGVQLRQFNLELLEYLRGMLLVKAGGDPKLLSLSQDARHRLRKQAEQVALGELVRYARLFNEAAQGLKTSLQPQLPLELAVIQAANPSEPALQSPRPATPAARPAAPRAKTPSAASSPSAQPREVTRPQMARTRESAVAADAGDATVTMFSERWEEILKAVRPVDKNAEAFLRSARPAAVEGDVLVIAFRHSFAKDKFEKHQCGTIVGKVASQVVGRPVQIRCQLEGKPAAARPRKVSEPAPTQARPEEKKSPGPATQAETAPDVEDDPVVKEATEQLGARILKVMPANQAADEPPLPDEPPPEDTL